jgi:protoheme IX farnesyltransferase
VSSVPTALAPAYPRTLGYLSLTKPDVTFLVVITTWAGYYMAATGPLDWLHLGHALLGTTMIGAGTSALNHYFERRSDAQMRRTANRPLPAGVLRPTEALAFGIGLAAGGAVYLGFAVNWLTSLLGVVTCVSYLGAYTPLKKHTTLATFIGAFPGAVPPLMGWAAVRGSLSVEAWVLYAILFVWQFPHFLAIAWMYREDYARAGIRMLPVVDHAGDATFRQILAYSAALIPTSLLPAVVGMAGIAYFYLALLLGVMMMQVSLWAARTRSNQRAKWLMHATVIYIPLLLGLLMWQRIP